MHAGLLSDIESGDVALEIFEEDKKFTCSPSVDINCRNNGIESKTKKSKIGYRFVDTSSSCKYYKEKMTGMPFYMK